MSNHFHLMVETPLGNLSRIMKHVNGSYTTYSTSGIKGRGTFFRDWYLRERLERLAENLNSQKCRPDPQTPFELDSYDFLSKCKFEES
jgi:hypothetical protein